MVLRSLLVLIVSLLCATAAQASGLVVWMEASTPEDKDLKKAQKLTGVTNHLAHADLAFPPQPADGGDDKAYSALSAAINAGMDEWLEFDVELGIARNLESKIDGINVVRNERDLSALVEARLLQGAAIYRSYNPATFLEDAESAPFRYQQPGYSANLGWVNALGLDPNRRLSRGDVVDEATLQSLLGMEADFKTLEPGILDLSTMPSGGELVIDGRVVPVQPGGKLVLAPGRHYVHVLKNNSIAGRQVVSVGSGETVTLPLAVDATELDQAKSQILTGLTTGFPDAVKKAIESVGKYQKGPIFVAGLDSAGQVVVLPYARSAKLVRKRRGAFILFGGAGIGVTKSRILEPNLTKASWVPTGLVQMGFEASYYNFCITGGADISVPGLRAVRYGSSDGTTGDDDQSTYILPQPWVGLGGYILRPLDHRHALLLAATAELMIPAHMGWGGRVVWSMPAKDGKAWFRVTAGGAAAQKPSQKWIDKSPTTYGDMGFVRLYLGFSGGGRF